MTVALGFSVIFLNLKMSVFMNCRKSENPRKKLMRRIGLRERQQKTQYAYKAEFGIRTREIGGVRIHNVNRNAN